MKNINKQAYKALNKAAIDGTMSDDKNPVFILSRTNTELLLAIANGELDIVNLAKFELSSRGIGSNGKWAGFDKAEKQWGTNK